MSGAARKLVVGVGNPWRRDDGIGWAVADALAAGDGAPPGVEVVRTDGDPARLLDLWDGAAVTVVVDAVQTGEPPGTVRRFEPGALDAGPPPAGTHALGIHQAVALGTTLGRMPERLVIIGIEGDDFGDGPGLSDRAAAAVGPAVRAVLEAVGAVR